MESVTLKLAIIGILALLLLIPSVMVEGLIQDRINHKNTAESSVSGSWGDSQILSGPFLTIPYTVFRENTDGEIIQIEKFLHFSPENLNIDGNLMKEERKLSIYDISLYKSDLDITGSFNIGAIRKMDSTSQIFHFEKAYLETGLKDPSGTEELNLEWNKNITEFQPGLPNNQISEAGVHAFVHLDKASDLYTFKLKVKIRGSKSLSFIPAGKTTNVRLTSDWPDPGFSGNYLPQHDIHKDGFSADWKIFHLSRSIPTHWFGEREWSYSSSFGVNLVQMVDEYQKNMRSAKYAFLVICLTFLSFFISEVTMKKRVHPFQYTMVGISLVIFYVLLISISEHLGFNSAYLISSVLTIGLISLYLKAIFKSSKTSLIFSGFFTLIYGLLFVILQMEGYSLLIGAISLFIAIGVTMYMTRNIDWYKEKE